MYEYKCKVLRVVDGDTVDVDIDLGFGVWMHKERVRIVGIDSPESRTRDLIEKRFGLAAKEFLRSLMPVGSTVIVRTQKDKTGKFGRILGDFIIDGERLSDLMIKENHAVPYHGQSKEQIMALHLINREILLEKGIVSLED